MRMVTASHSRKHNDTRDKAEDDYKIAFAHFQNSLSRSDPTSELAPSLSSLKIVADNVLQSQDQSELF